MTGLDTPLLVGLFAVAGVATWIAGMALSKTTDALDVRWGLGEELGGLLLLSVAGSLPELAITVSAAAQGHLGLAAGNLIGGIAVQTMVLVVCDIAVGRQRALTFLAGALSPVLEGLLVVLVVSGVLMGALLSPSTAIGGVVSPASIGIVVVWFFGVYVINKVRKSPRWSITMEGAQPGRRHRREPHPVQPHPFATRTTLQIAGIFSGACAVTLAAVWYYSGGGASKKRWARKHDNIYLYSKGSKWAFNADAVRTKYKWTAGQRRADQSERDLKKGKLPDDVWEHHGVMPWAKERLGYPTQKPEALIERLILASSNRGDIVLDPFCGCGTTVAVAQRLGRPWIGIDISSTAVPFMADRVTKVGATDVKVVGMPVGEDQLRALGALAFENWVIQRINGTHAPDRPPRGMGIDGYSFMEHHPVQVKQSDDIGRNVIDNFVAALRRAKRDKGFIIAFSFGKGARQEVARLKREDSVAIHLVKVADLLTATSELSRPAHDEMLKDLMPAARPQSALPSAEELMQSATGRRT